MKILNPIMLLLILILLSLNTGCSGRAIITSSDLPDQPIKTNNGRTITSKACGLLFQDIIPIMTNSRQERAWHKLLEKSQGKYITNIQVNESWSWWPYLGNSHCTQIQATVYPYVNSNRSNNRWSNGVEFGTFNKGKPQERIKRTGQIPIIVKGSPEYKERYQ